MVHFPIKERKGGESRVIQLIRKFGLLESSSQNQTLPVNPIPSQSNLVKSFFLRPCKFLHFKMATKRGYKESSCCKQCPESDPKLCPCCKQGDCHGMACLRRGQSQTDQLSLADLLGVNNSCGLDSLGLSSMIQDPLSSAFSSMARRTPFAGLLPTIGCQPQLIPPSSLLGKQSQDQISQIFGGESPFLLTSPMAGLLPKSPMNWNFRGNDANNLMTAASNGSPSWQPENLLNSFPFVPKGEYRTRTEFQAAISSAFEDAFPCLKGITKQAADLVAASQNQKEVQMDEDLAEDKKADDKSASEMETESESEAEPEPEASKKETKSQKRKSPRACKKSSASSPSRPKKTAVRRGRAKSTGVTKGANARNTRNTRARSTAGNGKSRRRSDSRTRKSRRNNRRS